MNTQKTGATNSTEHKWFVVKLAVLSDGYEKESVSLRQAEDSTEAYELALEGEAHGELFRTENYISESDGSFVYKLRSVTQVSEADAQVLGQHI